MANGSTGHCDRDVRDGRSQFDWVFTLGVDLLQVIHEVKPIDPLADGDDTQGGGTSGRGCQSLLVHDGGAIGVNRPPNVIKHLPIVRQLHRSPLNCTEAPWHRIL